MKSLPLLLSTAGLALANTAPTVVIKSAQMRPGTTLMDVVYRVDDPDDATVKTRALAFVDGVRSFAKVIRPLSFVEGTGAKLGDSISANMDHTLTWDVAEDWNIDLGQIKFEVLAMDGRGLLPFEWVTIPAVGGNPAVTVSKNSPTNTEVLDALLWQYAAGDSGLTLANGILTGNVESGVFDKVVLVDGGSLQVYSTPFVLKRMGLDVDDGVVSSQARVGFTDSHGWHAAMRPWSGVSIVQGWGGWGTGETSIPAQLSNVKDIAAGFNSGIALNNDGTVVQWGNTSYGGVRIAKPAALSGVTAIAAGDDHYMALKSDGTVVGWGSDLRAQSTVPAGLSGVTAIAAGAAHSLALKSDGTVVAWGSNEYDQSTVPEELSGVTAIAGGYFHSLALKSDGTVVAWGLNDQGQATVPEELSGLAAIAAGVSHSLALTSDGTLVGWGSSGSGEIPAGLTGVTAIAAGQHFSLVLMEDGTVVGYGYNPDGQISIPAGLSGVTAIDAGLVHSLTLKAKAP